MFKKAVKKDLKLRMSINGPSGSGKTYSALKIASNLGLRTALVDTEHKSASKYADDFDFDSLELENFHPKNFIEAIKAAELSGYDTIILDSLSHAWIGKGGELDIANQETLKSKSGNSFMAWRNVTPLHNELIDTIIRTNINVIVTMRVKQDYQILQNDGKAQVKKLGLAPIMRDGMEYEFDIVGDMDMDNNLIISKSRCSQISGKVFEKPGKEIADIIKKWLTAKVSIDMEIKNIMIALTNSDIKKIALIKNEIFKTLNLSGTVNELSNELKEIFLERLKDKLTDYEEEKEELS